MEAFSTLSGVEGHLTGGPRSLWRRLPFAPVGAVVALAFAWACGGSRPSPDGPQPARGEAFARPLEIYRDLGFMTGPGQFPAVASFATMAGPADSAYVLLGMSLPSSALRFQRDGDGFFAEYRIDVVFMDHDSSAVKRFDTREVVRVSTFAETGRTDESIIHQQGFTMAPGEYIVRVQAADVNSSRGFRMTDTVSVPDYTRGRAIATPVLVYSVTGRTAREALPELISNPRHTVPFGTGAPLPYVESYNSDGGPVDVRVVDEAGATVFSAPATLEQGTTDLHYAVVEIPADALPLGKFWVEVSGAGMAPARTPLVLTISDEWMVANVGELIDFMRYIAYPEELDSLQAGTPSDQRAAWERFWQRRDPLPVTEINEYRDQFFQRVRYATEAFREPGGRAGWDSDRGEVYIVLGPPNYMEERYIGRTDIGPNAEEWIYTALPGGQLTLLFHDRRGFGEYELLPSSESAFHAMAERLKPRPQRN